MRRIRELVQSGELGRVYAVDLVFHNAYGPDKPWFYDPALSGGGCVMDLGVHLVDLALWVLDFPASRASPAKLFAGGEPLGGRHDRVEDYAVATLELATGAVVQLACSWRLQAGCDAVISAAFYGTEGGARLAQRGRLVLRLHRRALPRHRARDARRRRPTPGAAAPPPTGRRASPPASASIRRRSGWSTWPGCSTASTGADRPGPGKGGASCPTHGRVATVRGTPRSRSSPLRCRGPSRRCGVAGGPLHGNLRRALRLRLRKARS